MKIIVGGNWGDEGKGKITDHLAQKTDYVVRYQGGSNAGHTIINEYGKFKLHLLPSGVFNKNCTNVLACDIALNLEEFFAELKEIKNKGVTEVKLKVSEKCQLVMPYHLLLDKLEEERLGTEKFGSTRSGIAPFYSDKYSKIGITVLDLFDEELLLKKLKRNVLLKNSLLENLYKSEIRYSVEELFNNLRPFRKKVAGLIINVEKTTLGCREGG